ncbi:MAG: prepilin-type N-terminal cleavage/methylation domain-containing protein [Patescibacteria group bacterium]
MKKIILGFTLVELLIVISILSVLALVVIAAINPIEQANKARDSKFQADSSQMVSAVERYFASNQTYPWVKTAASICGAGASVICSSVDSSMGYVNANATGVGICSGGCTNNSSTDGELVTKLELKDAFKNRDFLKTNANTGDQQTALGKGVGSSASLYACYIPLSKTVRQNAIDDGIVYTISNSGARTQTGGVGQPCNTPETWVNGALVGAGSCVICVPN